MRETNVCNIACLVKSDFLTPRLDYGAQFSAPQYKTDTNTRELVQQKVGKMTKGLEHPLYGEQLREHYCLGWKIEGSRESYHNVTKYLIARGKKIKRS